VTAIKSGALPAQSAAGADATTLIGAVEVEDGSGYGVSAVRILPPAGYSTVTGIATNNATFNVRHLRAGSADASPFATVTLAVGTNLVAEVPVTVPITSAPSVQPDDVFDVVMHQNGSGIAIGSGLFVEVEVN
jgi:hypothetical protein